MVCEAVGGINVFGGGVALYSRYPRCAAGWASAGIPHARITLWPGARVTPLGSTPFRAGLALPGDDNLIIDPAGRAGSFEHPECGGGGKVIIDDLPENFPIGD